MATVTHYIRSNYDPERDKDRLLIQTGQIDDHHWHEQSSLAGFHNSNRLKRPVNFVPATQPTSDSEPTPATSADHSRSDDVATWYRSLTRQSKSHHPRPLVAAARAISRSASEPEPCNNDSLADILSRKPPTTDRPFKPPVFLHLGPSNKGWAMLQNQGWSEGEALGPNSKRKNDDAHLRTGASVRKNERKKKKKKKKKKEDDEGGSGVSAGKLDDSAEPSTTSPSQVRITEATHDDENDIVIVDHRKTTITTTSVVPDSVIDLTLSDDSPSSSSSEWEDEDEDEPDMSMTPDSDSAPSRDPTTTHQTALLTPLPTVLKSDRLGIGLKPKRDGPYRSSVKRVTHNAAALAAHLKASEDARRAQRRFGKGRRAFARIECLERESRQKVMAYLSEPF